MFVFWDPNQGDSSKDNMLGFPIGFLFCSWMLCLETGMETPSSLPAPLTCFAAAGIPSSSILAIGVSQSSTRSQRLRCRNSPWRKSSWKPRSNPAAKIGQFQAKATAMPALNKLPGKTMERSEGASSSHRDRMLQALPKKGFKCRKRSQVALTVSEIFYLGSPL